MEPSLQHLVHCLEQSLGYKPHTPRDFDAVSEIISNVTGEAISASTLKRLWGYRKTESKPFTSTLDILARFLLYSDFEDFQSHEMLNGGGGDPHHKNDLLLKITSSPTTSAPANCYK